MFESLRMFREREVNVCQIELQSLAKVSVSTPSYLYTVAHKTVPMFCRFGQMDLMRSDDISNGSETFIKQTTHFWLYRTPEVM